MRIWAGYGSEHSMNLVMIGRFKSEGEAADAAELLEKLASIVEADDVTGHTTIDGAPERFSEALSAVLEQERIYMLHPGEIEQFAYDVSVSRQGSEISVHTDEVDVSAFLKVLVDKGAKVEVYSAHDYPDSDE